VSSRRRAEPMNRVSCRYTPSKTDRPAGASMIARERVDRGQRPWQRLPRARPWQRSASTPGQDHPRRHSVERRATADALSDRGSVELIRQLEVASQYREGTRSVAGGTAGEQINGT